jgi:hypothetical protein
MEGGEAGALAGHIHDSAAPKPASRRAALNSAEVICGLKRRILPYAATISALMRCTVPVPTPKRAAILCMPASPFASAAQIPRMLGESADALKEALTKVPAAAPKTCHLRQRP